MESINQLMNWYASNCDDEWEHTFSIKIQTIDNPGWSFKADIVDTEVEGKATFEESIDDDDDWYSIKSDGKTFKGYGDPKKLGFLLDKFAEFIKS